jgi:hypothetical protein
MKISIRRRAYCHICKNLQRVLLVDISIFEKVVTNAEKNPLHRIKSMMCDNCKSHYRNMGFRVSNWSMLEIITNVEEEVRCE